ncbi:serine/threonine protein kinase [Rhodanobacter sp. C06]|uniref:serine/threonine-protein kinase n=1 Tax=Rhodanobacter sp. C06 TaxID=1945854 RepID=UPI000985E72A|nr:protein kinase [Rhodanobacter sp. C06]OOG49366.1 serine/threonine protein kinase [Rhodanobacter sp. C06]
MTGQLTDRYLRAKRIVASVLEIGATDRDAAIARECGDDEALAREVRWMIAAIERSHTATLPLLPGDTVDLSGLDTQTSAPRRYRLVRRVGEGGMGVVYLAERADAGFVQQVALKVLGAGAVGSPTLLERFVRERQLLARLEHPGIARLLDGGVLADGQPFLAMEYVEGERIDAWCERHGLGLRERIALFLKVCAAVEYAHRSLVIHRDLKPANILVDAQGQPKLLDFGIARLIDAQAVEGALTETGQHALTLAYASPEQIEQQPLTTAVDVYGLGMVLYQLVAGRRPWQHITTPHQLSNAIVAGEIVPPSRSVPSPQANGGEAPRRPVPADIDAIALKALRRRASERYTTVGALAADLRNWLEQRPVLARRGRRLYRLRRFLQRNRWPLTAAAALLLSVFAGLATSLYSLHQARVQQRLAERREQQLERMVQFQQTMYDSVDIGAMGHALVASTQQQVDAALAPAASSAAPPAAGTLTKAFASVQATDIAREAMDDYVIGHTLAGLDRAFPDAPLLDAGLRQSLARALLGIGSYTHAADELRKVLAVRAKWLPAGDRDQLSVRVDLAQALEKQGRTTDAAAMYAQAEKLAQSEPSTDALRIAAEAGAARMLVEQGHLQQALQRQDALYAELKPRLPATDSGLMQLQRDLVMTLIGLGQRDRALQLAEPLVALDQRTLGPDNPQTLDAMLVQARLLHYRYEYERSLALARQVAAIRTQRLGADHPDTLAAAYMVAMDEVYLAQDPKAFAAAATDLQRVIVVRRRELGGDHPDTIAAETVMVRLLAKQGSYAKAPVEQRAYYAQAIALERQILAAHERQLGTDHPKTLMAHGSLASLLDDAGEYAQALAEAKLCLAGQLRVLGPQHPLISATRTLIGDIEDDAHHWAASRDAYRQALRQREQLLGLRDAHTIESASRLYSVLEELHDSAEATKVRQRYMDPVIAMDPKTLNASMRSVRDEAMRMLKQ